MYYNKTAIAAGLKKRGVITQPCSERLYTLSPCRSKSEGTYWRRQTSIQDIGLATRTLFVKKLINSVIGGSCLKQRYHNQTQRFRSRDGPHFDTGFLLDLWEPDVSISVLSTVPPARRTITVLLPFDTSINVNNVTVSPNWLLGI